MAAVLGKAQSVGFCRIKMYRHLVDICRRRSLTVWLRLDTIRWTLWRFCRVWSKRSHHAWITFTELQCKHFCLIIATKRLYSLTVFATDHHASIVRVFLDRVRHKDTRTSVDDILLTSCRRSYICVQRERQ